MFRFFTGKDTWGNSLKLAKKYCRLNTRSNFSNSLVTTKWNSLSDSFVTASSIMINAFKNRLEVYWENLPTNFNPDCHHWPPIPCVPHLPLWLMPLRTDWMPIGRIYLPSSILIATTDLLGHACHNLIFPVCRDNTRMVNRPG